MTRFRPSASGPGRLPGSSPHPPTSSRNPRPEGVRVSCVFLVNPKLSHTRLLRGVTRRLFSGFYATRVLKHSSGDVGAVAGGGGAGVCSGWRGSSQTRKQSSRRPGERALPGQGLVGSGRQPAAPAAWEAGDGASPPASLRPPLQPALPLLRWFLPVFAAVSRPGFCSDTSLRRGRGSLPGEGFASPGRPVTTPGSLL